MRDIPRFDHQRQTVFEIDRFCFKSLDPTEDITGKAALLLMDKFSSTSIAAIATSLQSIRVKMISVEVLDCTGIANQEFNRSLERLQQQTEVLKQQQAIFDQMMKAQRDAAKKSR